MQNNNNNKDNSIIIKRNTVVQCCNDLKRHALYTNRIRIMPSIKDGLKYVHRRIIYGALEKKAYNKKVKSANIVGHVIGTLHPHGDSSVYGAMKPLTNSFEIYMPLLEGHGNWGTIQGEPAAAQRYTESKISQFCIDTVIAGLVNNKQIVDWLPNFSNDGYEPESFPIAVPLLLINGVFGLGYGVRVDIPPFNINEVIDETIKLIKDPSREVYLIPDQCTPCEIIDTDFEKMSKLGRGKFTVRGIIDIEKDNKKGNYILHVRSTPDQVSLIKIKDKIEELAVNKKLPQVYRLYDETEDLNMDLSIILRRGADPEYVRDYIYAKTDLQKTVFVNLEVLDGPNPKRLNYKGYLTEFISYRMLTKFRLYTNLYQQVKTKYHEKQAYIDIIQSGKIDSILNYIRQYQGTDDATLMEWIISEFNITDLQARYIMNKESKKFSKGYLDKYIKEAQEYKAQLQVYLNKIINDDILAEEIIEELEYFKKKYGIPRKCKIISKSEINKIPEGDFKIVVTTNNHIKKIPLNNSIGTFKETSPKIVLKVKNSQNILLFSELGRVFKLPVHKIPISTNNSNGTDIRTIIPKLVSNIVHAVYEPTLEKISNNKIKHFITVLSRNGNIKKLDIEDFLAVPPSGIIYMKLDKEDYINSVSVIGDGLDVIVFTDNEALRMNISEIPHQKRNTKGLKSIASPDTDGLSIIYPSTTHIITVTNNGYINKSDVVSLPCIGRNKSGSGVIKLGKTDSIHSIFGLNENNILRIITKNDRYDIPVSDIEAGSSLSKGVKMIPMKNDNIISIQILKVK